MAGVITKRSATLWDPGTDGALIHKRETNITGYSIEMAEEAQGPRVSSSDSIVKKKAKKKKRKGKNEQDSNSHTEEVESVPRVSECVWRRVWCLCAVWLWDI